MTLYTYKHLAQTRPTRAINSVIVNACLEHKAGSPNNWECTELENRRAFAIASIVYLQHMSPTGPYGWTGCRESITTGPTAHLYIAGYLKGHAQVLGQRISLSKYNGAHARDCANADWNCLVNVRCSGCDKPRTWTAGTHTCATITSPPSRIPGRHIGGSLFSSTPQDLKAGHYVVKPLPAEDTHALLDAAGQEMAKHPNGFSCQILGECLTKREEARKQADFIISCGGAVTEAGWRAVEGTEAEPTFRRGWNNREPEIRERIQVDVL